MSLGPICDCLMRGKERCEIHGSSLLMGFGAGEKIVALEADIATLTAQNVILGIGVEEIICCGDGAQAMRDKAIAIHEQSQAGRAPSAVEAEIAALKAEVAQRKLETAIALQALTLIATPKQIHEATSAILASRARGNPPAPVDVEV